MFSNGGTIYSKKFGNSSLSQPNVFIMKKYLNLYFSIWCCIKQKLGKLILFSNLFTFFHNKCTLNHKLPFGKTQDYSPKVNTMTVVFHLSGLYHISPLDYSFNYMQQILYPQQQVYA